MVNKTPAKHRDIFRQKNFQAPARVRTDDLLSAKRMHYQLEDGDNFSNCVKMIDARTYKTVITDFLMLFFQYCMS